MQQIQHVETNIRNVLVNQICAQGTVRFFNQFTQWGILYIVQSVNYFYSHPHPLKFPPDGPQKISFKCSHILTTNI